MEVLTELTEVKKISYEERKKNVDTAKEEIIRIEKQKFDVELKKKKIEKQKLEVELKKEAREQKKDEREIMMMDTSYLSSIQLEYIQSLQMEIIQKRRTN
jgi:preprotein translocase subunit SecB